MTNYRAPEGRPPSRPPADDNIDAKIHALAVKYNGEAPKDGRVHNRFKFQQGPEHWAKAADGRRRLMRRRKNIARKQCDQLNLTETNATWMTAIDFSKSLGLHGSNGVRQTCKRRGWEYRNVTPYKILIVRVPHDAPQRRYAHYSAAPPITLLPAPAVPVPANINVPLPRDGWWRRFLLWCLR